MLVYFDTVGNLAFTGIAAYQPSENPSVSTRFSAKNRGFLPVL